MRARDDSHRDVVRFGGLAAAVHLVALGLGVLVLGDRSPGPDLTLGPGLLPGFAEIEQRTVVDLTSVDEVDPAWGSTPAPAPLPEADRAVADSAAAAVAPGLAGGVRVPAADRGEAEGRHVAPSWRRDPSTLRARLSDGSDTYQPSRERTAARASSPQAGRQEPIVGIGDSARTRVPQAAEPNPPRPQTPIEGEGEVEAPAPEAPASASAGTDDTRGQGRLDTELGRRAFDLERQGPARDTVAARAASNAAHPGVSDYAGVSAPGAADPGRGPGAAPGASPTPSRAATPTPAGQPWPSPRTTEPGEGTIERQFSREYQEIRRRVARVLRFPKRLALLLLQGEAIVHFVVGADGRVVGEVSLLKSAGYDEFDREAVEVVRRAAPFPPMRRSLQVRMRIPFENPVIR